MYILKLHANNANHYFTYFHPGRHTPQFEMHRMSIFPLDIAKQLEQELREQWNTFVTIHPVTVGDAVK